MRPAPFWLAWPLAWLSGVVGAVAGLFLAVLVIPHPPFHSRPGWVHETLVLIWLCGGVLSLSVPAYGALLGALCRQWPDWGRLALLGAAMLFTIVGGFTGLAFSGVTPRVLESFSIAVCTALSLAAGRRILRRNAGLA